MWIKRISAGAAVVAAGVMLMASVAVAESTFDDGDYTLILPGVGEFEFTIDAGGDETVVAVAAPTEYTIDDDDPDKAAWKDAASLEVEAKVDKVEGDFNWAEGDAELKLPGGSITVTEPGKDGTFTVEASGDWWAFGSGSDWMVADDKDIAAADRFFKVEATADGVEIKAVNEPSDGFLNDLEEEEEEEELEEEESEEEEEDEDEGEGRGNNNGRGRGNGGGDS